MTVLIGVGNPGFTKLIHFGTLLHEAYGHMPYLVGSAAQGKKWRDVDVRLMLPDNEFKVLFGDVPHFSLTARWSLLTASISAYGEQVTGLPIDFQFQPLTRANEKYDGPRIPIGVWLAKDLENPDVD